MVKLFSRLARDRRGATAIEYGLIIALVFVAMMTGIQATGSKTSALWQYSGDRVSAVIN